MRKLIFIIPLIVFSHSLQAQSKFKVDSLKLKNFLSDPRTMELLKRKHPEYFTGDTAYFSDKVFQGNVYRLQPDNMPCLKPDTIYVYNGSNYSSKNPYLTPRNNQMPNAIPVKPLIWDRNP